MILTDIFKKSDDNTELSTEEIVYMLSVPTSSQEYYQVLAKGAEISRELTGNKAEVQGQFALNLAPCPVNCQFCSFSSEYDIFKEPVEIDIDEAKAYADLFQNYKQNTAVLIMTTANYRLGRFIEFAAELRKMIKPEIPLIANVGDMTLDKAQKIKDAGVHGVYHAVRIGEGDITMVPIRQRLQTIRNFQEAGLIVGTCVEPVGPEHTNEQIAKHIKIAASFDPAFSGAARRITIPGSKLEKYGMITELRMAQIVAATRIATPRTVKGNCTHEPCVIGAAGGANLFWAEAGGNPRDIVEKTEEARGLTVDKCASLFNEADWETLDGPSFYYNKKHSVFADPSKF